MFHIGLASTPTPSPTETASVVSWVQYIPLIVAAVGLGGLLIGAVVASRAQIVVRLLANRHEKSLRFAEFQTNVVAAVTELCVALAIYIGQLKRWIETLAIENVARQRGENPSPSSLDGSHLERVKKAQAKWMLARAQSHAFPDQEVKWALDAFEHQLGEVLDATRQMRFAAAQEAAVELQSEQASQIYRTLQLRLLKDENGSVELMRARSLRRYLNKWSAHLVEQKKIANSAITQAESRGYRALIDSTPSPETGARSPDDPETSPQVR